MVVKYRCTKCERRFVDWGVDKVRAGETCEDCQGEYLEQIGHETAKAPAKKKPALKRKRTKAKKEAEPTPLASYDDDNTVAPDLETIAGGSTVESDDVNEVDEDYDDDDDDDDDGEPLELADEDETSDEEE